MIAPVLPDLALAPLRAMDEAALTHTVILETRVEVRAPGARITVTWVSEDPQPGRLNPAAAGGFNISADQPSAAGEWVLSLRSGSVITEGQRALVTGSTNGQAWQRLVSVNKVLWPKSKELRRRALCVDTELNQ